MAYVITRSDRPAVNSAITLSDVALNDSNKSLNVTSLLGSRGDLRVDSIRIELAATSTAGTRKLQVLVKEGSQVLMTRVMNVATDVAASGSVVIVLLPGEAYSLHGAEHLDFIPANMILHAGQTLEVLDNAAIDAAADDLKVFVRGRQF